MFPSQKELDLVFALVFKAIMSSAEWVKLAVQAAEVAREDIGPYNYYLNLDELEALYDKNGNEVSSASVSNMPLSNINKKVKKNLIIADQKTLTIEFDESIYENISAVNDRFYMADTSSRERMIIAAVLRATERFIARMYQLKGDNESKTLTKKNLMLKKTKESFIELSGIKLTSPNAYTLSENSLNRLRNKISKINGDIENEVELHNNPIYHKFKVEYELSFLKIFKDVLNDPELVDNKEINGQRAFDKNENINEAIIAHAADAFSKKHPFEELDANDKNTPIKFIAITEATDILNSFQALNLEPIDSYQLNKTFYKELEKAITQHEAMKIKMPPIQKKTFEKKLDIDIKLEQKLNSYLKIKERTNFDIKFENQRHQQNSVNVIVPAFDTKLGYN